MADCRSISYILKTLLDSLGLDEEQRQRRITLQKINQKLLAIGYNKRCGNIHTPLLSGSSFETTTIDGLSSDVDIMYIYNYVRVITDIENWRDDGVTTYLMDSTGCYKAFVKLHRLSPHYPGPLYADMLTSLPPFHEVDRDGHVLLCSNIGQALGAVIHGEAHGPAISTPDRKDLGFQETDSVFTLRCDSFPREAERWKQRQTSVTRTRINPAIIDGINHCYLVGVGNKNSPTVHLEWRLSFSHIENLLVHAWNNVQYQCYVLMKFIQKDLIKPFVPHALCSYHFKTLIMWMNEEYETQFFSSSQFEYCILTCLKNLAQSVRKRSMPHYFVEGCNLLYPKLTNNNDLANKLSIVIENIIATWPRCLFDISRCNLGRMFRDCFTQQLSLSSICANVIESRRQEEHWFEILNELQITCSSYFHARDVITSKCADCLNALSELFQMTNESNDETRKFITFAIKDVLCNIGLKWIQCENSVSNKTHLRNIYSGLQYIRKYRNSRCIDTGLKIAAHCAVTGKHRQALRYLDNIENQVIFCTCFECEHDGKFANRFEESHQVAVYDTKPSMMEFCKHYIGHAVIYSQQNIGYVPKTLVYEMFRSTSVSPLSDPRIYIWHSQAIIHCPVYMYYLRFLIHQIHGRNNHRQVALDNMKWSAKELSVCPGTHQETTHNIIGHCHRSTGDTRRAYKEYRKSLEIEKYNNAVLWHLAVLLRNQIRPE